MNSTLGLKLKELLLSWGLSEQFAAPIKTTIVVFAVLIIAYLAFLIATKIIFKILRKLVTNSKFIWDDIVFQPKILRRIAYIVPSIVIYLFAKSEELSYPVASLLVQKAMYIYIVIMVLLILDTFLNAVHDIYQTLPVSRNRPIKGYVQGIKIIIIIFGIILVIAKLFNKEPTTLFAGLGAMAAILILVFKDTILGFVSSIQLSANQMVKPGDWISMPSRNADGPVLEITLHTVKVQNWDKTISTIPTYALISESFQNWKGMEDSKGRRIARSVFIDIKSIRFCDQDMLEKFKKINLIKDYIIDKQEEIEKFNTELGIDINDQVSRRNLTNIGVFRKYMEIYLEKHPKIHDSKPPFLNLVRHFQPTEKGLPIQIYCFSKEQEWAKFEQVQADIFDHILAVVPQFELRIFQNPSSDDFRKFIMNT